MGGLDDVGSVDVAVVRAGRAGGVLPLHLAEEAAHVAGDDPELSKDGTVNVVSGGVLPRQQPFERDSEPCMQASFLNARKKEGHRNEALCAMDG